MYKFDSQHNVVYEFDCRGKTITFYVYDPGTGLVGPAQAIALVFEGIEQLELLPIFDIKSLADGNVLLACCTQRAAYIMTVFRESKTVIEHSRYKDSLAGCLPQSKPKIKNVMFNKVNGNFLMFIYRPCMFEAIPKQRFEQQTIFADTVCCNVMSPFNYGIIATSDGRICCVNPSGNLLQEIKPAEPGYIVNDLIFSANNKKMLAISADGKIIIWHIPALLHSDEEARWLVHTVRTEGRLAPVTCAALSIDGDNFVYGKDDGTVKICLANGIDYTATFSERVTACLWLPGDRICLSVDRQNYVITVISNVPTVIQLPPGMAQINFIPVQHPRHWEQASVSADGATALAHQVRSDVFGEAEIKTIIERCAAIELRIAGEFSSRKYLLSAFNQAINISLSTKTLFKTNMETLIRKIHVAQKAKFCGIETSSPTETTKMLLELYETIFKERLVLT